MQALHEPVPARAYARV